MTSSFPANVDGVGQPGFVARYGLYTPEQTAAAIMAQVPKNQPE